MAKNDPRKQKQQSEQTDAQVEKTEISVAELEQLQQQVTQAQESERRALADYQNLVRRQQSERQQTSKFATKALVSDLVQPLEHLSLASQQLNDQGLNMVIKQLWQTLESHGLQEMDLEGKPFDVTCMEAVENQSETEDPTDLQVIKVTRRGYRLNGEVLQFAKVVVG